jgi:hypothetical protein
LSTTTVKTVRKDAHGLAQLTFGRSLGMNDQSIRLGIGLVNGMNATAAAI